MEFGVGLFLACLFFILNTCNSQALERQWLFTPSETEMRGSEGGSSGPTSAVTRPELQRRGRRVCF